LRKEFTHPEIVDIPFPSLHAPVSPSTFSDAARVEEKEEKEMSTKTFFLLFPSGTSFLLLLPDGTARCLWVGGMEEQF